MISLSACKKHKVKKKATWITQAYQVLGSGKYPQIKAVNWWNDDWNKFENYYPGDNYVDWIGVSAYGQINRKDEYGSLEDKLDIVYGRMVALTNKPIAILETGMIE